MLSALVLSGIVFISGNGFAAESISIEDKLQQCELAFEKAHSGQLPQAEAWKEYRKHKELAKDILEDLNKRNAEIYKAKGKALSNEEILDNFIVMGRLLEMLATEYPAQTSKWGFPAYR